MIVTKENILKEDNKSDDSDDSYLETDSPFVVRAKTR